MPNYKELKKLADVCRKAGIQSFKSAEFEFTLSVDTPVSNYKKRQSKKEVEPATDIQIEDTITEDSLLFWSATNLEGKISEGN